MTSDFFPGPCHWHAARHTWQQHTEGVAVAVDLDHLRKMSDEQLIASIAGFQETSASYIAGMDELKRRREAASDKRVKIALAVVIGSILVSLIAMFIKVG